MRARIAGGWADLVAMTASAACLVHCLLLPIVLALAPAMSALAGLPEQLHLVAFCVAVPVSGWAMVRGYRLHGLATPALIGAWGIVALAFGSLGGFRWLVETGFTVIGSLLLGAAHLQNWRLGKGRESPLEPTI